MGPQHLCATVLFGWGERENTSCPSWKFCFVPGSDKWTSLERKLFNKALATYSKDFIFVQKMVSLFPLLIWKDLRDSRHHNSEISFTAFYNIPTKGLSSTIVRNDGAHYRDGVTPVLVWLETIRERIHRWLGLSCTEVSVCVHMCSCVCLCVCFCVCKSG